VGASALWLSAFLTARLLAAALPGLDPLLGYVLAFCLCATGAAGACALAVGTLPRGRLAWAVVALALLAWLLGNGLLGGGGLGHLLGSSALLALAVSAGRAVGDRVLKAGHLLPVAVVASAADVWSVLAPTGVTRAAVERPEVLPLLVMTFPYPGPGGYAPLLGAADLCIVALCLQVGRRFSLSPRRSAAAVGLGLLATLTAVVVLARPVPALPLLAGAFVACHWRAMHLSRREWLLLLVFSVGLAGVGVALSAVSPPS